MPKGQPYLFILLSTVWNLGIGALVGRVDQFPRKLKDKSKSTDAMNEERLSQEICNWKGIELSV